MKVHMQVPEHRSTQAAPPGHGAADSLELLQDPAADEREWWFERLGWAFLAVMILAGLSGLLGDGWLSRVRVTTRDGSTHADIERVARNGTAMEMRVLVPASSAAPNGRDTVQLRINQRFLQTASLGDVTPTPIASRATDEWLELSIERGDASRPLPIVLTATPHDNGPTHLTIGTAHGAIDAGIFVLP